MDLNILGWNDQFSQSFAPYRSLGYYAARVTSQHKNLYRVLSERGEELAQISGKMLFAVDKPSEFPAVGDWVVILPSNNNTAVISAVLPRMTKFSRKAAGDTTTEQVVAANINTVFIVAALNKEFNLRRIERYLTLVWESGANPVVVLNKADLCPDLEQALHEVAAITLGVPCYAISALNNTGLDNLARYFYPGHTVALLGSSGVGKSTLLNSILGKEVLRVNEVRSGDDKGRHTTTHRELFVLPQGGLLIDTPGMRELQLWASGDSCKDSFEDIELYAGNCQFKDCRHESEPNCGVKQAIAEGKIDPGRFENYLKMQKELAYLSDSQEYLASKEKLFKSYATILRNNKKKR